MTGFDGERINQILSGLVGVRCWRPHLSYGDELKLEMGDRVPYRSKLQAHLMRGSWMLGTRGSKWVVRQGTDIVVTSAEEPEQMETGIQALVDRTISEARLDAESLVLTIQFDGDYQIEVTPDTEDEEDKDYPLCDWELFTPDGDKVLQVGPGRRWVYAFGI